MSTTESPFTGTWTLDPDRSQFDVHHRPRAATLVIEPDDEGGYLIKAEGIGEKGQKETERPTTVIPDGQPRPIPDFPGLTATSTQIDSRTVHTEVKREDGSIVGKATLVLSLDGQSLTSVNSGFDSQLRQFEQRTLWRRG